MQQFDPAKAGISRIHLCRGALHYVEALKARLPDLRIEVMDNSVMANARGFWLAGTDSFAQ